MAHTEKQALLAHDGGAASGGGGHTSQSDEKRAEMAMFERVRQLQRPSKHCFGIR